MSYILTLGEKAKKVKFQLMTASTGKKNSALIRISEELRNNIDLIIEKNNIDLKMQKRTACQSQCLTDLSLTKKELTLLQMHV